MADQARIEQPAPVWVSIAAITAVMLATLVLRSIWWGDPAVDFDEQLYSHIGAKLLQGEWPYIDHWDRKPFGLFAIFGFAHGLFGAGPEAFQAMAAIAALVCAWLSYTIARDLTGVLTSAAAAVLIQVLLSVYGARSGQAEIFFLPFMLGMVYLLRDAKSARFNSRVIIAMLLGGIALQIKYTVLPQCIALGCYALFQHYRSGKTLLGITLRAALYAGLGILPSAFVGAIYLSLGAWDVWWFANFESFFLREPAGRFATYVWMFGLPLLLLMAGGWYGAVRLIKPDHRETYALVSLWALASLGSVLLPGTIYFYYLAALAPGAVLVAIPVIDARGPLRWFHPLILPTVAIIALAPHQRWEEARTSAIAVDRLAQAIAPLVDQDQACLYIHDGPTALYEASGSCTPSRFLYPDHLNNGLEIGAIGVDQAAEARRILATPPPAIVTANRPVTRQNRAVFAMVRDAIEADYELLHQEEIGNRTISAWRLKEQVE
ncbi:glycosyltransferase family 39 protein [Altererythrobacter lutimaris]|uniref:Glycosyltransferase family 39 protein n=1 Tax=Altererythrobacter lutimaris TaxID=2743979 RepID=A0A850HED2_9SPHN|nr:glycosyltransferase family 39 protein [Altererythrobacter lutimaris]NVE96050.1 glycosyltransferase family 39 protein [Altererythrobacter lutimaris]